MAATLENGRFYGRAGHALNVGGVLLTETTYGLGAVVPIHAHTHPFFCLPLEGAFVEHVERSRRTLSGNSAFYHPAAFDHAETFEHGEARLFNVQLGGDFLDRLVGQGIVLPAEHMPLPDGRIPALVLQLNGEYRLGGERLVVEGLVITMIGELLRLRRTRERGARPPWLRRVVDAIHTATPDSIGVAELATIAQVHPAHLMRTFRTVYGCTIGEYSRLLRVRRAMELLQQPTASLAGVAAQCGFADQSHFTRAFRATVGVTPAAYRRATTGS